jgi:CMP-N-acetylneuraminic acid synthetase
VSRENSALRREMELPQKRTRHESANLRTLPDHAISSRTTTLTRSSSLLQAQKFIAAYSAFLKRQGKLPIPGWVDTVKTSASNELPPQDQDWYERL